jgi:predicted transcriptional regulator
MNLQEQKIKEMNEKELMEYLEEQSKLPRNEREYTQKDIARIRGVGERTIRRQLSDFRNEGKVIEQLDIFTEEEIKVLKQVVADYQNNFFNANDIELKEYQIYKDLEKVKTDADLIRSAFNLSKETTERLKKFSSVRRIPLQDLVELAVVKLLEEYDK